MQASKQIMDACMKTTEKKSPKAQGGDARAKALSPETRSQIASRAATARWAKRPVVAKHKGNFNAEFGIDVDCYVLNDDKKTAVISQRGMGAALGFDESGGSRFPAFIQGKTISQYLGRELEEKLKNPLIFQWVASGANPQPPALIYGFDVTLLIDVCNAIARAERDLKLLASQAKTAAQAHVILSASAKAGIQGLVYALAGYDVTKEQVIAAFKAFVQAEAKKYEQEFPTELYLEWARLYQLRPGKSWKNMHLTIDHVYYPLAKSDGALLTLLRDARSKNGDRNKKLFQFLNEIGSRSLRIHLGRILEMAESSKDQVTYEARVCERFGSGQFSLSLPSALPPPSSQSPSVAQE